MVGVEVAAGMGSSEREGERLIVWRILRWLQLVIVRSRSHDGSGNEVGRFRQMRGRGVDGGRERGEVLVRLLVMLRLRLMLMVVLHQHLQLLLQLLLVNLSCKLGSFQLHLHLVTLGPSLATVIIIVDVLFQINLWIDRSLSRE